MGIIERLYVIDFIVAALCLKVVYTAVSRGLVNEIFKSTGLLIGSLFAFHYYPHLAAKVEANFPFLNKKYLSFVLFLLIFLGVMTVFSIVRKIVAFLYKKEEISVKERWVSFIIGGLRFVFLSSIIFFLMHLYSFNQRHYSKSISYSVFKNVAPKVYLVSLDFLNFYKIGSPKGSNKEVKKYYEIRTPLSGNNKEGD
ncbi:MAG: CvpA family protein [Candidatus Omnitrophota bacterium]|nr:MAG: CvpA family protein [Candidatus Omnitrophota bacterium]